MPKSYAIIENNIVVNIISVGDEDCVTEADGNAFVKSLGFSEGKDVDRPESPTQGVIGDQFNRELGRFQDDPNAQPDPAQRLIDEEDPSLGLEDDPTKEWFYNDSGRWAVRDIEG